MLRTLPLTDPATDRRRYVSLNLVADYLGINEKTLYKILDSGLMAYVNIGQRRKIELRELMAYEERQTVRRAG